jgi:hypothetical protein
MLAPDFQPFTATGGILRDVPMSLPLPKQFDILAEPGDIFW